jgi:adenine-specific DNA methylase
MSIEKNFDIPFVADLALREKQIQQNYRPVIAVHKWFARRPGALFRTLILSGFAQSSLRVEKRPGRLLTGSFYFPKMKMEVQ